VAAYNAFLVCAPRDWIDLVGIGGPTLAAVVAWASPRAAIGPLFSLGGFENTFAAGALATFFYVLPKCSLGRTDRYFWRVCLPSVTWVQGSEPRAISYV
jgi:hypothetical protein